MNSNDRKPVRELIDISKSLATVAKSLAVFALRMSPTKFNTDAERARFLSGLGLESADIAKILNTTRSTISARLSEGKRTNRRRKRGGKN